MQYQIENLLPLVEEALQNFHYPQKPESLYEPIRYFMNLPGKRIRPIFVLQCLELFRKPTENDATASLATELFHNFSLVHDDMMDKADLRRGFQTVHKKWNEPTALLAGDALLIFAYEALAYAPQTQLKDLIGRFNEMALAVCEGQQLDMDFSEMTLVSVEDYMEMIDRKTGALIAFSFEFAGFLAEVSKEERTALSQFGKNMGRCFQLRDDYLDLFGNEAITGKKKGGDIGNRKLTYPVLCSMAEVENSSFLDFWNDNDLPESKRIDACLQWMEARNIPDLCIQKIETEMEQGMKLLQKISGNSEAKTRLEKLCNLLAFRDK